MDFVWCSAGLNILSITFDWFEFSFSKFQKNKFNMIHIDSRNLKFIGWCKFYEWHSRNSASTWKKKPNCTNFSEQWRKNQGFIESFRSFIDGLCCTFTVWDDIFSSDLRVHERDLCSVELPDCLVEKLLFVNSVQLRPSPK